MPKHDPDVCGMFPPEEPPACPACAATWLPPSPEAAAETIRAVHDQLQGIAAAFAEADAAVRAAYEAKDAGQLEAAREARARAIERHYSAYYGLATLVELLLRAGAKDDRARPGLRRWLLTILEPDFERLADAIVGLEKRGRKLARRS